MFIVTATASTMLSNKQLMESNEKRNNYFDTTSVSGEILDSPLVYTQSIDNESVQNVIPRANFVGTTQLDIHARGITYNETSQCPASNPIQIFRVVAYLASHHSNSQVPEYISFRPKLCSGSCIMVEGRAQLTPLISTVYPWCPNKASIMRLFLAKTKISVTDAIVGNNLECEEVKVERKSFISRTQRLVTRYGTFEWRYANRSERKEAWNADSLMILEKVEESTQSGHKQGKKLTRVAQLVRNAQFRTPGTTKSMSGNGGRLMIDLQSWTDEKGTSNKEFEAFVIASCIGMLKREMDRNELVVIV